MLFRAYQALRVLYYPFVMKVFPLFSSALKNRLLFEQKNVMDLNCRSFAEDGKKAFAAFEVSSEGELEQIKPVLLRALSKGLLIELVFASDSVEKQCLSLAKTYAENLRIFRMPLLSYFPGRAGADVKRFLTAKKLFLCRYDFFPSLLSYGVSKNVEFILLSASLKSYENKSAAYRLLFANIYKRFDKILCATETDKTRFIEKVQIPKESLKTFDFRPLAIYDRIKKRKEKIEKNFPGGEAFFEALAKFPKEKRFVFGSFWEEEAEAFKGEADFNKNFVAIFPHRLDKESLKATVGAVKSAANSPVYELGSDADKNRETLKDYEESPGPIVVKLKGLLLESYPEFGQAFVGGGHGVSVHSLMEPFLAGCVVICGPKVHRSTEYDLIRENNPDRIQIVDSLPEVFQNFRKNENTRFSDHQRFLDRYISNEEHILDWLGMKEL